MFSRKNFSWKKWLTLTLLLFVFSWVIAFIIHAITGSDMENELYGAASLTRRFVITTLLSLALSFTNTGPKQ
jgi:hypothetical protein